MAKEKAAAGDGGERRALEVQARTVDEAVARGLVRLGGLSRSEVQIEVLSEGRAGLLGFGAEEALVRLTVLRPGERPEQAPAAAPTSPPAVPASAPPPQATPPPAVPPAASPAPVLPAAPPAEPQRPAPSPAATSVPARPVIEPTGGPGEPAPPVGGPAPADPARVSEEAREVTLTLLRLLGFEGASVEPGEALLPDDVDEGASLVLGIRGPQTDRLLAHDAEALNALQFLVRLVVSRRVEGWVSVLLDVNGDRARRVQELLEMAAQSAALVEREQRPVALPPMSAYERRVIHLALRDHDEVATQSIGSGAYRKVTVRPKDQLLPRGV